MAMLDPGDIYVEPFCGALGVASRLAPLRPEQLMWLNDISKPLILMWRGLHQGTISLDDVPADIDRREWARRKYDRDDDDWMTALIGHGMSFNARYYEAWVGYTSTRRVKESIRLKLACINNSVIHWTHSDYLDMVLGPRCVIYCDPPYEGAKKVHNSQSGRAFNWNTYYGWCAGHYLMGRKIIISGREKPTVGEWECVYDWGDTNPWYSRNGVKGSGPAEKLWVPTSQAWMFSDPSRSRIGHLTGV